MKSFPIFTHLHPKFSIIIYAYFFCTSSFAYDDRVLIKDVNWCVSPYCKAKSEHTICKWGPLCPTAKKCETNVDFNKEMKDYVMELHNIKRNKVALGEESMIPKAVQKAANMKALQWDIHLEFVARCHSRQCDRKHDVCRAVPRFSVVGQNIYTKKLSKEESKDPDVQDVLEQAIEDWYSQVENAPQDVYKKWDETEISSAEYTQMIWARTGYIGCGLSQLKQKESLELFLVCNYGMGGNIQGKSIYIIGEPCSKCLKGKKCNSKYEGLCGAIEDYAMKCPCEEENGE